MMATTLSQNARVQEYPDHFADKIHQVKAFSSDRGGFVSSHSPCCSLEWLFDIRILKHQFENERKKHVPMIVPGCYIVR